ncbi:MAG: NAD-dependent epimerase/dehydratase family protein [Gammaproteobacteria bacterium]|jgi:nucleoside-diphosphate-sugar epimerase|nr:NAD-dependent epimerase/dehydratase family protein [Gammaproteobacteria bacterium]
MRLVVTGSSGFIGRNLLLWLHQQGYNDLVLPLRKPAADSHPLPQATVIVDDFCSVEKWSEVLREGDIVVHLAGLAHQSLPVANAEQLFFAANVAPVKALAQAAVQCGVAQILFVSSIGVNGSYSEQAITAKSETKPDYPYACSKLHAERVLAEVCEGHLSYKILRIPLVYGADAPANFRDLLTLVSHKLPLPFGLVKARKSFIAIDHLVEVISRLIELDNDTERCFVAADRDTVSLSELIDILSDGMGHKVVNLAVPVALLRFVFKLSGKTSLYQKLCLPLTVDASRTYELLKWWPTSAASEKLKAVARQFSEKTLSR